MNYSAVALASGARRRPWAFIGPPIFTQQSPPAAQAGTAYSYNYAATNTNVNGYSLASGSLAGSGLTLGTNGALTGATPVAGTYNFVVQATGPGGTQLSTAQSITVTSVIALAELPFPVLTSMAPNSSPSYSGTGTLNGSASPIARMQSIADPGGSGRIVYLHRMVREEWAPGGGATGVNICRSERIHIDQGKYMFPGNEYWMAFAFRIKGDEWPAGSSDTDADMLWMQTHSESNGETQPPLAMYFGKDCAERRWETTWSAATQAQTKQGIDIYPMGTTASLKDIWVKCKIRIRPGWLVGQSPLLQIWETVGNAAEALVVNNTNFNDYNWNTGTYPRIGGYKWTGTRWNNGASMAIYLTKLYWEANTGSKAKADAALAGL